LFFSFFHGIGGGLFAYLLFLHELIKNNKGRAIFLVETPSVSMKMVTRCPSMEELVPEGIKYPKKF
jgi:hypothetical protein